MCLVRSRLTVAIQTLAVALTYVVGGANAATVKVADLTGTVVRQNDGLTIQLSAQLNTGDHIVARSQDARVLLECAGGATQMLTEGFDAVIVGTGKGVACAVDLNQGTAVATTAPQADGATGATIKTGDVTLGARSTQFGISVRAGANGAKAIECFVVEGEVTVGGWASIKTLSTAQLVRVGDPTVKPISAAKYELLASSYAELATSRAPGAAAQTTELKNAYLRSFRNPADSEARFALATRQELLAPGSSMSRYQQAHAKKLQSAVAVPDGPPAGVPVQPVPGGTHVGPPREKGYRIDVCRVWAAECGQQAADAWCQLKGHHRAQSYSIEQDIGASDPTIVLGSGQLCKEAYCDAFRRIVCE